LIGQPARLQKEWDAPIYVFFKALPIIEYIKNCKTHAFECAAGNFKAKKCFVHQYLDTSDSKSTSNMRHHARVCWGDEAVDAADGTKNKHIAEAALKSLKTKNGSITEAFQQVAKGTATYSTRQHTKIQARYAQLESSFDSS